MYLLNLMLLIGIARLIARSVVVQDRFQSYVPLGQPRWLSNIFGQDVTN